MPHLLDRMPFNKDPGEVFVRNERVRIRADQIIVWVSLGSVRGSEPNPSAVPFPTILDIGHNHSFAISERHLNQWARLELPAMEERGHVRDRNLRVPLHAANIWVHPNVRGLRDQLAETPPFLLRARSGIAVYPGGDFPRLPILGLRAIAENNLVLKVSGPRREANLRPAHSWWPFD